MPIFRRENGQLAAVPGNYAILDQTGKLSTEMYGILGTIYVISDSIMLSHDAEEQGAGGGVYVETKTISLDLLFPSPSTLRIVFEAKRGASITTNARIYKNGVVHGVSHYPLSTEYVTYIEDLEFAQGDTLGLWTYDEASLGVWVRNFRVLGSKMLQFSDPDSIFPDCLVGSNS